MNLIQLIKKVLDDAYQEIDAEDDQEKNRLIEQEMSRLSSAYTQLATPGTSPIDYSCPLKRFAYIYKYTVAHADYIMQLVRKHKELKACFEQEHVEVACIGGGPGSDLLGLLKYLTRNKNKLSSLTCYIFDKERAWGDSWSDVAIQLNPKFQLNPVFQQMDITVEDTWKSYRKLLRSDIFTLSYFLSEVYSLKSSAEPFLDHVMASMKKDALMLFVDNNDSRFVDWFDGLATKHGLTILVSDSGELCFSNDEEKRDFGEYFKAFGWPKRKGYAAWRIVRRD